MQINDLLRLINQHIPFNRAEDWDNVGLLIGDTESHVTGILTTLDCTLEVVEEAIEKECNTIIAHHPLIFSGIKTIHNHGYGKVMHALIKNDISLIAMHTNLDAHPKGVSAMIADCIGLINQQILLPYEREMNKLQVYVPAEHAAQLKCALAAAGAGQMGNYTECFYQTEGKGQFRPDDSADPYIGKSNQLEVVDELRLECVFEPKLKQNIEQALLSSHPYEEPAYDIYSFQVKDSFGTGIKGEVPQAVVLEKWLPEIKQHLGISSLRLIGDHKKEVKTVAIISGSGVSYKEQVQSQGVDLFLTGDIKYHDAHDLLMMNLTTADIEHYSEVVMVEGLRDLLTALNADLKVLASEQSSDPFTVI
ncbi:Nif3-like dinuclear metal center hexameric protein [Macrococcus hajekii]|uniref:GTP cyclohydrolase 1 type 2 homolog n=1 Tax=Macrococcus hajekii TaxID=198482 RepID=A0A4R6BMJ5_9STAP|nr:Nif3-like dinuclear metal center hexameric protein [Macrococcus hajekii]TDM02892.1 Nif3-like dinuclear metal center hexameric protein [Macrococcus hajekii]GGB04698.1 GTP cyclohydrolase 1 type 2 [Macrococcus hajekii]